MCPLFAFHRCLSGCIWGDPVDHIVRPPAFYRSVVFWLGLFVFSFLVWAWADSWKTMTMVYRPQLVEGAIMREACDEGLLFEDGKFVLHRARVETRVPWLKVRREPLVYQREKGEFAWWMARLNTGVDRDDELVSIKCDRLEVPMWGIVAAYANLWAGALAWLRRRWWRLAGGIGMGEMAGDGAVM